MTNREHDATEALTRIYHNFFTGLLLTIASRKGHEAAGEFSYLFFRRQHHDKFLPGIQKLGLADLPPAVACARYHYLSNRIGGVDVEYFEESDRKVWIRFTHPRWIYEGAAICAIPVDVPRGYVRGWYAQNAVSLNVPEMEFVCTSEDVTGQYGFAGYFQQHDHPLPHDQRWRFARGEDLPETSVGTPPEPDPAEWPEERLRKARRNYAMDYVRNGLMSLYDQFGPLDAEWLGTTTGHFIGRQFWQETAEALGLDSRSPESFVTGMRALMDAEGDPAEIASDGKKPVFTISPTRIVVPSEPSARTAAVIWASIWQGAWSATGAKPHLDAIPQTDAKVRFRAA